MVNFRWLVLDTLLLLIALLYWLLSSCFFLRSSMLLGSQAFMRNCSDSFWASTIERSFIQGAIGWVKFTRPLAACSSIKLVKNFFSVNIWSSGSSNSKSMLNSFMMQVPIIYKRVHWFVEQINGMVSIW